MSEKKPDPMFEAAMPVVQREAVHLVRIALTVPDEVRVAHTWPGQYLLWHPHGADKPRPMALANAPGEPFELLMKDESERFPAPGHKALVSLPGGKGFPLDTLAGRNLLLVGTGSGVAPLIAVLRALSRDRHGVQKVTLLYGAKSASHAAYVDERARLAAQGFEMLVALSGNDVVEGTLRGRVSAHIPSWVDENTSVFVCGQREMMDAITDAVVERGVPRARVHRNF
jgi:NAD(P)H-flavin reductase